MTRLFVICGHGAGDPGACGNGYQEAERVRVLGKRIKELGGDNVMLGDVNRNYYADNGISNLGIPKDYQIIELHMDSSKSTTARGAHVIIRAGLDADQYDKALAKYLSTLLPGRSQTIVGRDDLANPDRAYVAGYSYRLVEIGFISNAQDVTIFNANIDTIAKGILDCFGIGANGNVTPSPKPQPTKPVTNKPDQILRVGEKFKIAGVHRVDQVLADRDSIWSLEMTGNEGNSIPADPLTKCDRNGNTTANQVFKVGDYFKCDKVFTVLAVDAATDAVKANVGGREIWLYAKPLVEVI